MTLRDSIFSINFPFQLQAWVDDDKWFRCVFFPCFFSFSRVFHWIKRIFIFCCLWKDSVYCQKSFEERRLLYLSFFCCAFHFSCTFTHCYVIEWMCMKCRKHFKNFTFSEFLISRFIVNLWFEIFFYIGWAKKSEKNTWLFEIKLQSTPEKNHKVTFRYLFFWERKKYRKNSKSYTKAFRSFQNPPGYISREDSSR